MTAEPDIRTTSVYLILKKGNWRYDPPTVVAMRKTKPALASGEVAVKVNIRIPMEMFNTFIPEIVAELEEANVLAPEGELADLS